MKNINFRSLLKQAFTFSWRNKRLWWLGLFAGGGEIVFNVMQKSQAAGTGAVNVLGYSLLLISAVTIIIIAVSAVSFAGRAGLLIGIKKEKGALSYNVSALWTAGFKNVWRLLLVNIILLVAPIILSIPVLFYLAASNPNVFSTIIFAVFGLALLVYAVAVAFCRHYIYCFAVLEEQPAWNAIQSGWNLFRNNFGALALTGVIQIVLRVIAGFAVLLVVMIVALPIVLLGIVLTMLLGKVAMFMLAGLAVACAIVAFGFLHGALSVGFNKFLTEVWWEVRG